MRTDQEILNFSWNETNKRFKVDAVISEGLPAGANKIGSVDCYVKDNIDLEGWAITGTATSGTAIATKPGDGGGSLTTFAPLLRAIAVQRLLLAH